MENKYTNQDYPPRLDAPEKVAGRSRFAADFTAPGMLYGAMLFSTYRHADILHVEPPVPGPSEVVLTGADLETTCLWNLFPILCTDRVRSFGDVVAIAAAPTRAQAEDLLSQVKVEYAPLPACESIEDGLACKAVLHEEFADNIWPSACYVLRRTTEVRNPDRVYERRYCTQCVEHAYLEPEAALAIPDFEQMKVIASVQYPFSARKAVCDALGLSFTSVSIIQPAVGGTFGGKEESAGLLCARASLLARAAGRPVKLCCTREESILMSSKRHPFRIDYRIETDQEGNILHWHSDLVDDLGAYNARAKNMNWRASVHAAGPYRALSWDTRVRGVFTNNLISGAMRGYSAPQIVFAHESIVDEIAQDLGKDFIEYRKQICLRTGDRFATGQDMGELPFLSMLAQAQQAFSQWEERYAGLDPNLYRVGKGVSIVTRGCGLGAEYPDATGAQITLLKDGSLLLQTSLAELGQGLHTALGVVVCRELGISMERVRFPEMNTSYMEDGGSTVASRGTYAGGSAMLLAVRMLRERMFGCLAAEYGIPFQTVTLAEGGFQAGGHFVPFDDIVSLLGKHGLSYSALGWFSPETVVIDHATGQGNAYKDYSHSCVAVLSLINRLTGAVSVKQVLCIHDVGMVIHRGNIENQIRGGVSMGLGFALMEECSISSGGVKNANLDRYLIPTVLDMPEIQIELLELPSHQGPYGAKSLGEPATEAVGAAVARSVVNGVGCRAESLPLTQEKIVRLLWEQQP